MTEARQEAVISEFFRYDDEDSRKSMVDILISSHLHEHESDLPYGDWSYLDPEEISAALKKWLEIAHDVGFSAGTQISYP